MEAMYIVLQKPNLNSQSKPNRLVFFINERVFINENKKKYGIIVLGIIIVFA